MLRFELGEVSLMSTLWCSMAPYGWCGTSLDWWRIISTCSLTDLSTELTVRSEISCCVSRTLGRVTAASHSQQSSGEIQRNIRTLISTSVMTGADTRRQCGVRPEILNSVLGTWNLHFEMTGGPEQSLTFFCFIFDNPYRRSFVTSVIYITIYQEASECRDGWPGLAL